MPGGGTVYRVCKRSFDIFFSFLGIIALLPVYAAIAVLIKVTSPGSILYRATRTGKNNQLFTILKFRTMEQNADLGAKTTSKNDTRVTRVGRFLRKYKLDEIPQLFNVLRGEMSFVGPRPELPEYTNRYTPDEKVILQVTPGITDYSSVYFSNLSELIDDEDPDASFETKVLPVKNQLRVKYATERSFLLDMKLLVLTVVAILKK